MINSLKSELVTELMRNKANLNDIETLLSVFDSVISRYEIKLKDNLPEVVQTKTLEYLHYYLISCKLQGYSEDTLYSKYTILGNFLQCINKPLNKITAIDIKLWLEGWKKQRKLTDNSLEKYRQMINAFFTWCVNEELLIKNPATNIKKIHCEEKTRQPLNQFELEYIRKACKTPREKAIIEVLFSTGCRVAELAGLKISDIDFEEGVVKLFGKGKKERKSFLNPKSQIAIKEYLNERGDSVENLIVTDRNPIRQMDTSGIRRVIDKITERVKDKLIHRVTPHVFRHTTATIALKNGMGIEQISKLLGHKKLDTTRIYAEVDDTLLKIQHARCIL